MVPGEEKSILNTEDRTVTSLMSSIHIHSLTEAYIHFGFRFLRTSLEAYFDFELTWTS
jgi:hypothetical protein